MVDVAGEAAARSADHPSDAEVELLWAGASTAPDVRRVAAAARDARLEYVLDVADRQRVGPLLLRSLGSAGVDVETLRSDAIGRAQLWGAHAKLALPAAATAALQPLNEAGLRPLVLKGLALVDRYPAPGLRPMDDIDLLLPREVIRPAAKVLLGAGWRQISHQQPDPGYDVALRHPSAPGVPLELHYELARWQERTNDIDARRVWAARTPLEVFGRPAWGLPPELELVTLIAHAAKRFHLFRRLLWSVDFAVVAATPGFDWDAVARIAADARCRVATAIGLRLARRVGATVPDDLLELPPFIVRSGALAALLDPTRPFSVHGSQRWLGYVLADDVVGKIRLAGGDLLRPPRGEPRRQVAASIARALQRVAPLVARAGLRPRRDV
ncbi:MAG TPA: nucleotidyltransferase family protein [Actinomycetota bacterium]|jgi:hypothetical protein|nr:nucleotidyltransferase family protein [Actinomycetota bacterium]